MPGESQTPITLPAALVARVEEAAAADATTPEAWVARVLTRQLDERRWQYLVSAGQQQSETLGYTEDDVERLIEESRADRRERPR